MGGGRVTTNPTPREATLLARDPDTLTLAELADLAFGPMPEKETP